MSSRFSSYWNRPHEFEFTFDGTTPVRYCRYGASFATWAEELIQQVTQHPTDVAVNVAKLHLCERYWSWFVSVPRPHQNQIGHRDHHVCIFQVYRDAYFKLHAIGLSLTPLRLVEPPLPVSPPPAPQIAGIVLGEDDDGQ